MAAPIFVKIDKYKEVNEAINKVKSRLEEAKNTLKEISELKEQEDKEIKTWQEELDAMEQKIGFITQKLSKPETE